MWTIYRHAKGMLYIGLGAALHSEDLTPYQQYRCLYENELSKSWIRPLEMFQERVSEEQLRFTPVGRVRVVSPQDESRVLSFGYDTWGAGRPLQEFLAEYDSDRNHLVGTGYLFELMDGTTVSALNTLRFFRDRVGIARVATDVAQRSRGYATILMKATLEILRLENADMRFLLFSEIDPIFYQQLGFVTLPMEWQHFSPSVAMISGDAPALRSDQALVQKYF